MEFTFIEEMIRRRSSSGRRWAIIVAVAAFIVMGALFFFKYLEIVPINSVEDFLSERSKRHPYVRLEDAFLYNTYYTLTEERTENGRVTSSDNYTYFLYIDYNEDEYRMFLAQLKGVVEIEYFEDYIGEGRLKRLGSVDKEVVQDLIYDYGLYEEDIVVTGIFREEEDPEVLGWIFFILAGLAGVIFIIMYISGTTVYANPGKVAALRKAREQHPSVIYSMESAARGGREIYSDPKLLIAEGGIFGIGKKQGMFTWIFTPMQGLMLVSMTKVTHRIYGIKAATELLVKLYFNDKREVLLKPGISEPDDLYDALITNCPDVLVDADKKLQKLFKRKFDKFEAEVAERLKTQNEIAVTMSSPESSQTPLSSPYQTD